MQDQEIINKILEKEFKKTVFAGYDATDVDNFFDQIIDYVNSLFQSNDMYKQEIEKLKITNMQLQSKNNDLMQQILQKDTIIKQFESEGYVNVHNNRRFSNLEKMVNKEK